MATRPILPRNSPPYPENLIFVCNMGAHTPVPRAEYLLHFNSKQVSVGFQAQLQDMRPFAGKQGSTYLLLPAEEAR